MLRRLVLFFLPLAAALAADPPPPMRFSVEHMDRSVAPGDDFFRFATGTWLKNNSIPAERASWGPTEALIERNYGILRALLDTAASAPQRSEAQRLAGDFYAAAIDEARLDALAFTPLDADLARIAALKTTAEWCALLGELHVRSEGAGFGWYVAPDSKQSDRYALHIDQGGLSLPEREYYLAKTFAKERDAFLAHMEKMFALAGDDAALAKKNAAIVLRLETALAKVSKPAEDLNDAVANYHKLTRAELAKAAPGFAWDDYWNALGASPEVVIAGQPEFLAAFAKLLAKEPLDDWRVYLRWHLLSGAAPFLHRAADGLHFEFFGKVLDGRQQQRPRWKRAIMAVDGSLGDALGQLYVADNFPPEAKVRMETMVALIKKAFRTRIENAAWMSAETRAKAVEKLERFRAKLGYPDKWKDYAGLEIRRDDYLGNTRRANAWESRRELARLGGEVDRSEWHMTAPTVNAYFSQNFNEIVFPAGILQPPFFDLTMDDAVNYGATGSVIGHEMTHGFDSEGRKFDAEGNLAGWWTWRDGKEYERRAKVLVEQFSALEALPGVKVNGKLTLPENIADLGGVMLGYEALKLRLAAEPAQRRDIDGLAPEQRYFLSYAQSWASLARDEMLRQRATNDSHAPDKLRAVVPLRNFAPWYEAFAIGEGAKLFIPVKKRAEVW